MRNKSKNKWMSIIDSMYVNIPQKSMKDAFVIFKILLFSFQKLSLSGTVLSKISKNIC